MDDTKEFTLTDETLPAIEHIADSMPGGFFIYRADESEEIVFVNSALLTIYGCSDRSEFAALTGNTFRGMVHPEDVDDVESSIAGQIAGSGAALDYVEYRIIRRDGTVRYVDDYGHLVHTGNMGDLYYVFINDATDKRLAEQAERERQVNRAKMSFLFNISHDIRTPMNSIMGFTALAKCHINEPEILRGYLDKVDMSNRHMMSLIDDILEMSSVESGRIQIRNDVCSIPEQISAVIDMIRPQAKDKHISLETDISLPEESVYTDSARFRRVMSNLLGNAVKFTPDGGRVWVRASAEKVNKPGFARYEVVVGDNGIGMSEEFLTRIFGAFEREASSTESGYPGTGLGLSITKSLLDLLGGTISVTSRKGEGSEFTVSLPLRLAESEKPEEGTKPAAEPGANAGKRILLVEDIEINRMLAETVLKRSGFRVECAVDGRDAVDAVHGHPDKYYDLILMDIQMPVMDGYEATRAIRATGREYTDRLPIIALSANASAEDKRMSAECGMNTHIAKPFEINDLIGTVNKYLGSDTIFN